jgi:hypothetical protein
MSEDNFLDRWSRRKRGLENEKDSEQEQAGLPSEAAVPDVESEKQQPATEDKAEVQEPAFDLSQLPSIDSITATTDIRMFMLPGVPLVLRQAALRKVWMIDPKIRDFIEMAENQWDFTVNSPGFDFSPPSGDIQKMVAEIFGKSHDEKEAEAKLTAAEPEPVPSREETVKKEVVATETVRLTETDAGSENRKAIPDPVQAEPDTEIAEEKKSGDIASQNDAATRDQIGQAIPRRRHGSALPG